MKECGIVALWQVCSGTGIFLTKHRNTQYTVCLIFRRTNCYAVKLTLHKSHSKILWQSIWLIMEEFYKKNRLSCCLWLQPLLIQKMKGLFLTVWISGNKTFRRKIILYEINILTHWGQGNLNCLNARSRGFNNFNPLNAELNPTCYLLALLAQHFLHVSRIRIESLTLRLLMSYIYGAPILDVSSSHTTTQHSR
jgi:hypothetical protein